MTETLATSDYEQLTLTETGKERSLLRVWKEILSNIEQSAEERIDLGLAGRLVRNWPQLSFQDIPTYHRLYHELLQECRGPLIEALDTYPDAIDIPVEEDLSENEHIYRDLLVSWNLIISDKAEKWDVTDPESHIQFAVIFDVQAFLLDSRGLVGHLEARGFTITTEELTEAIEEARGKDE